MSTYPHEQIMVVSTELLTQLGYFQGFTTAVGKYLDQLMDARNTSYRPRPEMEKDPSFKQLIPYVIFQHVNASGAVSLFQYTRGTGMGEKRLHTKRSVGIGGHISSIDAGGDEPYAKGMHRELDEEVIVSSSYNLQCVGLINDDQTEVGKVHLGVVYIADVDLPAVQPRETEIVDAGFRPLEQIMGQLDEFESWSRISLEALFG